MEWTETFVLTEKPRDVSADDDLKREDALFDELFARADELNEDPLHGFLVGLKMMSELMADLPNGHPGCVVASFCYQDRLFNRDVRDLTREGEPS